LLLALGVGYIHKGLWE